MNAKPRAAKRGFIYDMERRRLSIYVDRVETAYLDADERVAGGKIVLSSPPEGCYKVKNIYSIKEGEDFKLMVEYEDTPET